MDKFENKISFVIGGNSTLKAIKFLWQVDTIL